MKKTQGTTIFAYHYKPGSVISKKEGYVHIWAGKNNAPEFRPLIGDDSGEHISGKNKYYSELTGIYWIWKNNTSNVVGSCHYRRYFTDKKEPILYRLKRLLYYPAGLWKKRFGLIYTKNYKRWEPNILSVKMANTYLKEYGAILPTRRILKYSVEEHYKRYHNCEDLELLRKILTADYPEYINAFNAVLEGNRLFANNMFIFPKEKFDALMTWLFDILFQFENEINLDDYKNYQERIFGFLSERLITVWVEHHQLSYKELPLIYFKKLKPIK